MRRARPVEPAGDAGGEPGTVVGLGAEGLVVACGEESRLLLVEVQPESRRAMGAAAFAAGARLRPGDRLA